MGLFGKKCKRCGNRFLIGMAISDYCQTCINSDPQLKQEYEEKSRQNKRMCLRCIHYQKGIWHTGLFMDLGSGKEPAKCLKRNISFKDLTEELAFAQNCEFFKDREELLNEIRAKK